MEHLPSPQQTVNYPNIMVHGDASSSGHGSATLGPAAGQRLRSAAASTTTTSDSGSIRSRSTSTHSRERVLGSIFGRRASILTNGRRPKSTTSNRSSSVNHDDLSTSETFEMTPMSRHKKKRIVEDIEKRVDRVKADAALAKWRVRTQHVLSSHCRDGSRSSHRSRCRATRCIPVQRVCTATGCQGTQTHSRATRSDRSIHQCPLRSSQSPCPIRLPPSQRTHTTFPSLFSLPPHTSPTASLEAPHTGTATQQQAIPAHQEVTSPLRSRLGQSFLALRTFTLPNRCAR